MKMFILKFCGRRIPEGGWICVWLSNTVEMDVSKTVWPQKLQVTKLLMGFFHNVLCVNSVYPGNFFVRSQEVRQVVAEAEFIKPGFLCKAVVSCVVSAVANSNILDFCGQNCIRQWGLVIWYSSSTQLCYNNIFTSLCQVWVKLCNKLQNCWEAMWNWRWKKNDIVLRFTFKTDMCLDILTLLYSFVHRR